MSVFERLLESRGQRPSIVDVLNACFLNAFTLKKCVFVIGAPCCQVPVRGALGVNVPMYLEAQAD